MARTVVNKSRSTDQVGAGSFQAKQQKVTLPNHKRKKKKKKEKVGKPTRFGELGRDWARIYYFIMIK
jgi:hypothetical protein